MLFKRKLLHTCEFCKSFRIFLKHLCRVSHKVVIQYSHSLLWILSYLKQEHVFNFLPMRVI